MSLSDSWKRKEEGAACAICGERETEGEEEEGEKEEGHES